MPARARAQYGTPSRTTNPVQHPTWHPLRGMAERWDGLSYCDGSSSLEKPSPKVRV